MATANLSKNDMQLEIFHIVWLDANPQENRNTMQKLRSIFNRLEIFQAIEPCQRFVEKRAKNERLVMIVSGRLGQEILRNIHKLPQVASVYVYCMDVETHEKWARTFSKIRAVVKDLDQIIDEIKATCRIQEIVEEPFSCNLYAEQSTMELKGAFVFSQLLIDCLLRLKSDETDVKELITRCKNLYQNDEFELKNIDDFQKKYSPDKVLSWYTKNSFFYKTLNAALRIQDINTIYLFRAFIVDIHHTLKTHQARSLIQTYRCQRISRDELKNLKKFSGQFISINSFFSTSLSKSKALQFLNSSDMTENHEQVLFEIDADPKVVTTKPFAKVAQFSEYPEEEEVLFMLGSIFRLESVEFSTSRYVHIIRMTLCSDDQHELQNILTHMKQRIGSGETNLRTLGKLLWDMGKLDLAERYMIRYLERVPRNDPSLATLYEELAKIASQTNQLDKSLEWHQKSIDAARKNPSSNSNIPQASNSCVKFNIPSNARWSQNGVTVAGGNGQGNAKNQLNDPLSIAVDDNQTIIIADQYNHRILEWKKDATRGKVIIGGDDEDNQLYQLNQPTDILIDKETNSFIICDEGQVIQRSRHSDKKRQETLIDDIDCIQLAMDDQRNLYVSDYRKHEVRRYRLGDKHGTLVAGGNGKGVGRNQLNNPRFLFVDQQQCVYVSDTDNNRVMKWNKGAKEGIVVAGGQGKGDGPQQLYCPQGLIVDASGTLYVADQNNHRVMRWSPGAKQGTVIVGGNGSGTGANQLNVPCGLSFDQYGNLYVVDSCNHRVQRFLIEKN